MKLITGNLFVGLLVLLFIRDAHNRSFTPSKGVILEVGVTYPIEISKELLINNDQSWSDVVNSFAGQLSRAFNIPDDVATKYAPIILQADINTGLSEIRIASIIMTESSFRENVESWAGAYGSMQIRPKYWSSFCTQKGYEIKSFDGNILCGAEIISFLMNKFCYKEEDQIACALKHYNVGRGNLLAKQKYRQAGARYTRKISEFSQLLTRNQYLSTAR